MLKCSFITARRLCVRMRLIKICLAHLSSSETDNTILINTHAHTHTYTHTHMLRQAQNNYQGNELSQQLKLLLVLSEFSLLHPRRISTKLPYCLFTQDGSLCTTFHSQNLGLAA